MSQANTERNSSGTRRLTEAVRAAKIDAAQRTDVVVDIREADRARLEIFAEELQPIVDALPAEDDFFDFMLSGGPVPRFWIDGTAHVTMARDRRTYRFLRETRLGRVSLAETGDVHALVDHVTEYVAERIVERERAYALSDAVSERLTPPRDSGDAPIAAPAGKAAPSSASLAVLWLLIGIAGGMAALAALAAVRGVPII